MHPHAFGSWERASRAFVHQALWCACGGAKRLLRSRDLSRVVLSAAAMRLSWPFSRHRRNLWCSEDLFASSCVMQCSHGLVAVGSARKHAAQEGRRVILMSVWALRLDSSSRILWVFR